MELIDPLSPFDQVSYIYALLFPVTGYLIGSIPFGLLLSKFFGYGDIRKIGSGNIGATNVLRTGNKKLAALTLLLDGLKGFCAVFLLSAPDFLQVSVGLCAIIGHCFPVWLKFKGGKGVATALGVLLAAVPYAGLAACSVWLAAAFLFKISSLAALLAFLVAPLVTLIFYGVTPAFVCALITLLIFMRHRANISRLIKGEEPKIGKKKEASI